MSTFSSFRMNAVLNKKKNHFRMKDYIIEDKPQLLENFAYLSWIFENGWNFKCSFVFKHFKGLNIGVQTWRNTFLLPVAHTPYNFNNFSSLSSYMYEKNFFTGTCIIRTFSFSKCMKMLLHRDTNCLTNSKEELELFPHNVK